jgi:hypothetical protein
MTTVSRIPLTPTAHDHPLNVKAKLKPKPKTRKRGKR